MSNPLSFEHLADIRDGARRMVERSRLHEGDLNRLVETAEGAARHATALASLSSGDTNADELSRLCADQARLSVEHSPATVRACAGAREQHVEAHRLQGVAHRLRDETGRDYHGPHDARVERARGHASDQSTHSTRESRVIAYTANGSIPPPLERWFVAIVSKPSPPDVVLAAVQNAVSV
jgi:hypothetical protein